MSVKYWKKNPIQNGCKREKCEFWNRFYELCDYQDRHDHSRTSLHQDEENVDINNPCREYTPRRKENSV